LVLYARQDHGPLSEEVSAGRQRSGIRDQMSDVRCQRTMKTNCGFTGLALMLVLAFSKSLSPTAFAQGSTFTYQGRLNDGANPANGHYDLIFALYDAASGG